MEKELINRSVSYQIQSKNTLIDKYKRIVILYKYGDNLNSMYGHWMSEKIAINLANKLVRIINFDEEKLGKYLKNEAISDVDNIYYHIFSDSMFISETIKSTLKVFVDLRLKIVMLEITNCFNSSYKGFGINLTLSFEDIELFIDRIME